jgi:hypothetical protein
MEIKCLHQSLNVFSLAVCSLNLHFTNFLFNITPFLQPDLFILAVSKFLPFCRPFQPAGDPGHVALPLVLFRLFTSTPEFTSHCPSSSSTFFSLSHPVFFFLAAEKEEPKSKHAYADNISVHSPFLVFYS